MGQRRSTLGAVSDSLIATTTPAAPSTPIQSALVTDLSRNSIRAYFLERVDGALRFVAKSELRFDAARTSAADPDLWPRLLRELKRASGHRLLAVDHLIVPQQPRGDGVDAWLQSAALGATPRGAFLHLGTGPMGSAVRDAVRRSAVSLLEVSVPERGSGTLGADLHIESLRSFQPEALVALVAGNETALHRFLQLLRDGIGSRPLDLITIAAPANTQGRIERTLVGQTNLRFLPPVAQAAESVISTLEEDLVAFAHARLVAGPDLGSPLTRPPISRPLAVSAMTRSIARSFNRRVVTISINDGCHVYRATAGQSVMVSLPLVDLDAGITSLTAEEITEAVRWLPFPVAASDLLAWVVNRSIRPWTVPYQPRDLLIEQALARQIARRGLAEIVRANPLALSDTDLVIGGPMFYRGGQPGSAALALLDSIDVVPNGGVLDLVLDRDGLLAVAGALEGLDPACATDIAEFDGLSHLGSAVILGGSTAGDELACRGELHREKGEPIAFSVAAGNLEVLPLRYGETASLVIRPERRFSVGGRPAGTAVTFSGNQRVSGGTVGVIVDARGRSLTAGPLDRPAKVKRWLDTVNRASIPVGRRG
ncbi:MAG: hypothetical protein M3354_05730 [Chloroflexota bacterium]|nr:hypothetical protein [Chloroflexota bacterium]